MFKEKIPMETGRKLNLEEGVSQCSKSTLSWAQVIFQVSAKVCLGSTFSQSLWESIPQPRCGICSTAWMWNLRWLWSQPFPSCDLHPHQDCDWEEIWRGLAGACLNLLAVALFLTNVLVASTVIVKIFFLSFFPFAIIVLFCFESGAF